MRFSAPSVEGTSRGASYNPPRERRPARATPLALAAASSVALAASLGMGDLGAQTLPPTQPGFPVFLQAQVGSATLSQQGSTLVVTTTNGTTAGTSGYSLLNWQSFSIPAGGSVRFVQPSDANVPISTSINRVSGGQPSNLLGALSSNGRLVLVNPAGIAVGAGAVVDTAGFTASTVDAAEDELLAGRQGSLLRSRALDGQAAADLTVQGSILARHGDVFLVGGQVGHSGRIEAQEVALDGGQVVLRALSEARVSGTVIARAEGGLRGGGIDVFGPQVVLESGALLDASGSLSGGRVRVGGDFLESRAAQQTADAVTVPTAGNTEVAAGATIRADATLQGAGGQVVLWSSANTGSAGAISARGGASGGDGGQVEVGSGGQLAFISAVDTRAPQGRMGELFINTPHIELLPAGSAPDPMSGATQIVADGLAATTRYRLQARGAITSAAPMLLPRDTDLSLEAGADLAVTAPITASGSGTVSLKANGLTTPTDPQAVTLRIQAPITAAAITLSAAGPGSVIDLQGAELLATQGRVALTAPSVMMAGTNWLWGSQGAAISGDASLASGASLRLSGPVANGLAAAGRLAVSGLFTVAAGAQLRMAMGGSGYDQIQLTGSGSAHFAGSSTLVLDLLTGAGRPAGGTYRLIDGPTSGVLLPALQTASAAASSALAGVRLRWGSLEALLPAQGSTGPQVLQGLKPPKDPQEPEGPQEDSQDGAAATGAVGYEGDGLDCP